MGSQAMSPSYYFNYINLDKSHIWCDYGGNVNWINFLSPLLSAPINLWAYLLAFSSKIWGESPTLHLENGQMVVKVRSVFWFCGSCNAHESRWESFVGGPQKCGTQVAWKTMMLSYSIFKDLSQILKSCFANMVSYICTFIHSYM